MVDWKRIFSHMLFWGLSSLFLSLFLGHRSDDLRMTLLFTGILMPVAIATSYTFNYFLFPRYLFRKHYFRFALYTFFFIVFSIYLQMLIVVAAFILIANYEYGSMVPGTTNVINLAVGIYFIVFLSALIYLVKRWSRMAENDREEKPFTIRINRETARLDPSTILMIESLDNYVKIHLTNRKQYIVKEKISRLSERLPGYFLRTHRSFIVNLQHVESYTREYVKIESHTVPISRTYKTSAIEALGE